MVDDLLTQAKEALERGEAEAARTLVDQAYRKEPANAEVREMYTALRLALAIRLAARAREARREDIVRRDIPYETEFDDAPEVTQAFDGAAAELEEVLVAEPKHEKALVMKASLLFRRNRETGRPAALAILRGIAESNPANRQVLYAIRKVEVPCKRCGDSGFCSRCRGRGYRRVLGFESKCEACHGQGICIVCGIL